MERGSVRCSSSPHGHVVNLMTKKGRGPPGKRLWAYAYDVKLPEEDGRFREIEDLLEREHSDARDGARTWAGRLVVDPQVTRILVVSDSPEQNQDVNRRIAAELVRLEATFEMTVPLAVGDDPASASGPMNGRTSKKP